MFGHASIPFGLSGGGRLIDVLTAASLTTNLKLCLDAGDGSSYNPGTQTAKWLDTSGGGYDFYRGTSAAGDAAEPTFWGTADAVTKNEYFRFDGADYFTYDSANETWMQALHKDSAVLSACCWSWLADTANEYLLGTSGNTSPTGVRWGFNSGIQFNVYNAGSVVFQFEGSTPSKNAWHFFGVAIDEPGNSRIYRIDGTTSTGTCIYSSPASGDASCVMQIGSSGTTFGLQASGSRIAMLAMWQGTALTSANFTTIYNATAPRFA